MKNEEYWLELNKTTEEYTQTNFETNKAKLASAPGSDTYMELTQIFQEL